MVITKKSLSRRTMLRGLGAAIALPLLDGMIPAFAAGTRPVKLLGVVYVPNRMSMPFWTPAAEGNLELSPISTPLPMESNPRAVFEHLFGASDSTEREARLRRLRGDRSLLDSVAEELAGLRRTLGRGDRSKLAGYLDSVRDIERRIQIAETQSDRELPAVAQPAGIPAKFEDYAALMFDLMAVAFQADLTRVATFLFGREKNVRTYPEIGIADP